MSASSLWWFKCLLLLCLADVCLCEATFEDVRCRCVCPSAQYFSGENRTEKDENHRRFYTMSNMNPSTCNAATVVGHEVRQLIEEGKLDAFLANCECRHESRNTVMLKVVVIFVMCLITLLVVYMSFLMCLDPMLRKQRFGQAAAAFNYRQQTNEIEANIFAANQAAVASSVSESSTDDLATDSPPSTSTTVRARTQSGNVLERVEAEQSRWMKKVEEQRKNIFQDHSMLN